MPEAQRLLSGLMGFNSILYIGNSKGFPDTFLRSATLARDPA